MAATSMIKHTTGRIAVVAAAAAAVALLAGCRGSGDDTGYAVEGRVEQRYTDYDCPRTAGRAVTQSLTAISGGSTGGGFKSSTSGGTTSGGSTSGGKGSTGGGVSLNKGSSTSGTGKGATSGGTSGKSGGTTVGKSGGGTFVAPKPRKISPQNLPVPQPRPHHTRGCDVDYMLLVRTKGGALYKQEIDIYAHYHRCPKGKPFPACTTKNKKH
ncbi:hypothetical protein [Streptomyces sp. NBC_00470]|uniref:hypothetical protein n=1 Tax=Streptomyces sp. NBC_00470 TaxID=2975753 RepID=UPI002F90A1DF